jgi:acyl-CoA thioester hydrolase
VEFHLARHRPCILELLFHPATYSWTRLSISGVNLLRDHTKVRVIYADTDAMGIVYHTNYIKWFEIGRTELLRKVGLVYAQIESQGYNLPLTEAYCHYLLPARYDQILVVETEMDYIKRASMKFNYVIWDENLEKVFVEGYTVHACTNNQGKIIRIPSFINDTINDYNHLKTGTGMIYGK